MKKKRKKEEKKEIGEIPREKINRVNFPTNFSWDRVFAGGSRRFLPKRSALQKRHLSAFEENYLQWDRIYLKALREVPYIF
jgi:hypothetical protein